MQCFKCQRYGHISKYCKRDYRCVKCDSKHNPGQCGLSNDENSLEKSDVFCVGCAQSRHPASYRGCPKYKEKYDYIKNNVKIAEERRLDWIKKTSNFVSPDKTYAMAVSPISEQITLRDINDNKTEELPPLPVAPPVSPLEKVGSILDSFKESILDAVNEQLVLVKSQVMANFKQINSILDILEKQNGDK